ncbi:hypothetical protein NOF04DRAFT_21425 [Fusarium oxysporum II5]|uniref:Uncharacterized protein n=2 Tax=Fusarium oxysporum species complex TaxID=171631 RepID=X0L3P5_FUSO5|nr:uncharacterized protein FOIG_06304 [Fusarium odoratissimum NRRL 54006]EXM03510.1 hypothetical protein FOIG_06304 [Fusarium odoratissimum NRRL 54006]KAK2134599.1 hypothetical protein NOF04DRAFT_21425 [Fusarium oxysporum II5]TXC11098.1 hypothetical protein FocTR4_00007540 [Fusarium oxysporum f. sp. cubense]
MSNIPIPSNNSSEVAEDVDFSSLLPTRLTSSSRQNTGTSIPPSVFTSVSSVYESAHTSITPSDQGDSNALAGGNTLFGISFGSAPPNTPADNNDGVSLSNKPPSKSGWTGEYSDPGTPAANMSKLGWTGEYSTSGVEPEHLMARLSTVANKSDDGSHKTQNGAEGRSSGESSRTKGGDNAFTVRDIFSEDEKVARLALQAIGRVTPRSVMESLDVRQVKSGVVTVTKSPAQPQSAVLCNIEDESVPKAEEAVLSSPTELKSAKAFKFVKGEKASIMGRISCCMRAIKMGRRPKPGIPVNKPKHATLSPEKSCLKPATSLAGTVLDEIEEDSPLQPVPAPKPSKGTRVTFDLDETAKSEKSKSKRKRKSKSKTNLSFNIAPYFFSKMSNQEIQDTSDENEELDDPNSPFAAQDLEIQRRLAKADCYRDANERTSIIRGALDFLLVVSDRVDTVAADRISCLLDRTADRGLGSYTGEEKDHVNPHQYGNRVDQRLYRSKETAMSYLRRRQPRTFIRLGTPCMRDCQQFFY